MLSMLSLSVSAIGIWRCKTKTDDRMKVKRRMTPINSDRFLWKSRAQRSTSDRSPNPLSKQEPRWLKPVLFRVKLKSATFFVSMPTQPAKAVKLLPLFLPLLESAADNITEIHRIHLCKIVLGPFINLRLYLVQTMPSLLAFWWEILDQLHFKPSSPTSAPTSAPLAVDARRVRWIKSDWFERPGLHSSDVTPFKRTSIIYEYILNLDKQIASSISTSLLLRQSKEEYIFCVFSSIFARTELLIAESFVTVASWYLMNDLYLSGSTSYSSILVFVTHDFCWLLIA